MNKTDVTLPLKGGCLCGAVRYEVTGGIEGAAHCHCRMCQRATGAPVVPWFTVKGGHFRVTQGAPRLRNSSELARRGFCAECGTQLTFQYLKDEDRSIDITLASLDDPEVMAPEFQIWVGSRPSWMHGFDRDLPVRKGTNEI